MTLKLWNSRRRFVGGTICAAFVFAACFGVGGSIPKCAVMALAFILVSLVQIKISERLTGLVTILGILFSAFVGLFLSQFVLGEGLASVTRPAVFLGYCCCLSVMGICFLLIANMRIAGSMGVGAILMLATANYFVFSFRGTELRFIDLFSVSTAANVASQYEYVLTANLVYGWVICFLYVFALGSVEIKPIPWKSKGHFLPAVVLCGAILVVRLGAEKVTPYHFGNDGTYKNGYILNFALTVSECFVEKPDHYSADRVAAVAEAYDPPSRGSARPHIIVIMDEAYADLRVLGSSINANCELSPFINSLEENTVKGYAFSSAYGGRTANSEFEVLTGLTMGFLPENSIAYQQYMYEGQYGMVSQLKRLGYRTIAAHPYHGNGWLRDSVWPGMGFDECYFLEDFQQEDTVRGLVSDQEMVDFIISSYERRAAASPLFFYGVTMQNHSGYDYAGEDFETSVQLKGYAQEYSDAEQYLTLIQMTDAAVEKLVDYFSQEDEPVVILFYGDHLPALSQDFYHEIHGGAFSDLDEQMRQYMVPFFIWTNYDVEEQYVECTSLNFLSNYLYEAAGIELPAYNQFLKELEDHIPACNMLGYHSVSNGGYRVYDEATGVEKEWLEKYQILQYNVLFDRENLSTIFNEG